MQKSMKHRAKMLFVCLHVNDTPVIGNHLNGTEELKVTLNSEFDEKFVCAILLSIILLENEICCYKQTKGTILLQNMLNRNPTYSHV